MDERNYWCYRIDKSRSDFFWNELNQGRLRQGWGYDEGQDLRNLTTDGGARRNLPMFNKVKKGDILLVPELPEWGYVAIVEATEDWNIGYRYEIDKDWDDYGHIFPARYIRKFLRHSENVTGNIRSTLGNRARFWNINHYGDDVKILLEVELTELEKAVNYGDRLESTIEKVFNEIFDGNEFSKNLYNKLIEQFRKGEWEFALVHGLRQIFPSYSIEKVGGSNESVHGTDILIKIPGIIPDFEYCIAIQVKDYEGFVQSNVIEQINKAEYWNSESMKLIEKIVLITRADKDVNKKLIDNDSGVKFIFASELKTILSNIGKAFVGIK
jgi:hypothetical protein